MTTTLQLVDSGTCSIYDVPLVERLRVAGVALAPDESATVVAERHHEALTHSDASVGTLVRLFCKSATGANHVVYLRGAPPYMYVQAPPEFTAAHVPEFSQFVERLVDGARCVSVAMVRDRKQYMGYSDRCTPLLRITLDDPRHIAKLRNAWLGGAKDAPPIRLMDMRFERRVWEADVQYHMRVCVDRKLAPFSWVALPDATGSLHNDATHTIVAADAVQALGSTGAHSQISPHLRAVAFDIECEALVPGTFPTASRDPIISIGNVVYEGVDTARVLDAVVFITVPPELARPARPAQCPCCVCAAPPPPCACCICRAYPTREIHEDDEAAHCDCAACLADNRAAWEARQAVLRAGRHCECAACLDRAAREREADERARTTVRRHAGALDVEPERFRVVELADERTMLRTWAAHMREVWRPHFLLGYNSALFDMPYVRDRCQVLNCWADAGRLSPWDTAALTQLRKNNINTRAHGQRDDYVIVIPGVLHVDAFCIITKEARCRDGTKPRSYKLGDIAAEFLSPDPDAPAADDGAETDEDEWGLDDEPAPTPSADVREQAARELDAGTMRIVTKRDLHHSQIAPHYHGTPEQRWTLCDYNEWDARLVGMLNNRLKLIQNLIGMARVTYVDVTALIHGGQQIKVHMQMLALAPELGFVIPTRWREPRQDEVPTTEPDAEEPDAADPDPRYERVEVRGQTQLAIAAPLNANGKRNGSDDEAGGADPSALDNAAAQQHAAGRAGGAVQLGTQYARVKRLKRKVATRKREKAYEGAVVIEPKRGFYQLPITTLDFSSLYPSIMRAHNLSHDTLVLEARRCAHGHDMLNSEEALHCCVHKTPLGDRFVNAEVHKGLLVVLLERLLGERGAAKRAMGDAKRRGDAAEEAVQDGRQLALKISANSVYGFTGATIGKLPCLEISAGVTSYGRDMITSIQALVEEVYPMRTRLVANQQADTEVVYGDSVAAFERIWLKLPEPPAPGSANATDPLWARLEGGADVTIEEAFTTLCDKESVTWHGDKESAVPRRPLLCRSKSGWVPLARVIRHKLPPGKQMVKLGFVGDVGTWTEWRGWAPCPLDSSSRALSWHADLPPEPDINDGAGVCVTADHSLLRADGSVVSPFDLSAQMARDSQIKLDRPPDDSQLAPYRLLSAPPVRSRTGVPEVLQVASLYNVTSKFDANSYVYDLQTEDHTFMVGSRGLIVHNTDSIMVKFGVPTVGEACDIGRRAAALINAFFDLRVLTPQERAEVAAAAAAALPGAPAVDPDDLLRWLKEQPDAMAKLISGKRRGAIAIVFEKVLWRYLLIAKKRYVGDYYLVPERPDHMHQSGVESVRRDNSLFTNELVREVVRILVKRGNVQRAVRYARKQVRDLARGRVPFDKLVVSRAYNKKISDYADAKKGAVAAMAAARRQTVDDDDAGDGDADGTRYTGAQPHLIVVQKRLDRHDEPFKMGDRVPYVLVMPQGQDAMAVRKRKPTQADIVEDVEYAKRHCLMPHADYYVRHQAEKPLTRIFDTVLGEGATRRLVLTPDVTRVAIAPVRDDERFFGAFKRAAAARDDDAELPPAKAARTGADSETTPDAAAALFDEAARRHAHELGTPTSTLTAAAAGDVPEAAARPISVQDQIDRWKQRSRGGGQRTMDSFFGKR